jgi:hypothetical protein
MLRTAIIVSALLFAACANHEGLYEPACIAYEGDRMTLRDGRFEWQRFTDQRSVDDDGNIVNPFPGFPKTGTYDFVAGRLELVTNDGVRLDDWFVVVQDGQRYLLTNKQHIAILDGNERPECALRLTDNDS